MSLKRMPIRSFKAEREMNETIKCSNGVKRSKSNKFIMINHQRFHDEHSHQGRREPP